MTARRGTFGPLGLQKEEGIATVTLSGGNGSTNISFRDGFLRAPAVLVVPRESDSGAYAAASVTKSGFTVTVTSSDFSSGDIQVAYIAIEKGR